MKQYLKALRDYEKSNYRYEQLTQYLTQRNSSLIKQYREGAINLPSFIIMKELHSKYFALCDQDDELNNLFIHATECSKLFYLKISTLASSSRRKGEEFEDTFNKIAQPLGQRLINLLINIKFRIRVARLNRKVKSKSSCSKIFHKAGLVFTPISRLVNQLIYKASLFQSTHHNLTKRIYHLILIFSTFSLISINSSLSENYSSMTIIIINTLLCILLGISAIIMHPVGDFGRIDISGKNIVAYKYRVFFNNISNQKIHNIFTMQHAYDTGHNLNQTIDSS